MRPVVTVSGLEKWFGDLEVLRDIEFALDEGETLAVLGPSGCGKTTLLRILLGLESADAGHVSRLLDRAGYVPQGSLLLPWKRVMENLELPLQLQGVDKGARRTSIRSNLSIFGLEGFENAFPFELSGGMQQRVALLRAVSAGARTLILDEPFGALDTVTRNRLQEWLSDVVEQLSCSMLFVTHDLDEAVVLARRILVLSERPARAIGHLEPALAPHDRTDRLSGAFLGARGALVDLVVRGAAHA
jgi:ABC-type nitrate/sulfonate/bicarbonate transport system ATPase subunit